MAKRPAVFSRPKPKPKAVEEYNDEEEATPTKATSQEKKSKAPVTGSDKHVFDGTNKVADHRVVSKPDRYVSHTLTSHLINMFTLDRMTLFFFSLSNSYTATREDNKNTGLIKEWAKSIPLDSQASSKARSSASIPSLTVGSTSHSSRTLQPPPSNRSALNNNVKIRRADDDIVEISDDEQGAFSE